MSFRHSRYFKILFVVPLLMSLSRIASADEGMWVFNNIPKEKLKAKYGFEANQKWLDHVMKSSVRFNSGGSGSFVSKTGLVITNHHVAADTLQKISDAKHNYLVNGFYAATPEQEKPALDLELNVLQSIEDVTEKVKASFRGLEGDAAVKAKRAAIAEIEKASKQQTGLRSNVVTLYNGGQYHLYRYKRYTDVRLVFAPEKGIAFFGGDLDNFEYPRYDLDIAIFRVYENGKPIHPENYLEWAKTDAKPDDLIFVSGHPGSTDRMFTVAQMKYMRDFYVPFILRVLLRREITLQQYSLRGPEQKRQAEEELFYIQNSRKVYFNGRVPALQDPKLFSKFVEREKDLLTAAKKKPRGKEEDLRAYAKAWDKIALAQRVKTRIFKRYSLLERSLGFDSTLFTVARTLVRAAAEDKLPNSERLEEFRESNRDSLKQTLFSEAPIYPALEKAKLTSSLEFLVETLGANNELMEKVLAGKGPVERAEELVNGSQLAKVGVRKSLYDKPELLTESKDPMILLAQAVDKAAREVRKTYEEKVTLREAQGYADIAHVIFALKGTSQYPDATFTLRLSYGQVKGYHEDNEAIPASTTLGGAYTHAEEHGNQGDFALPPRWMERKKDLNLEQVFDFVSTADIIGGNSGSPVLNREAQFTGIIFDGNIESLSGDFVYDDIKSRAVAVHSGAILEALKHAYGVDSLVEELLK